MITPATKISAQGFELCHCCRKLSGKPNRSQLAILVFVCALVTPHRENHHILLIPDTP